MTQNTETLLIVFVALTGVAVLLQACILVAMFVSIRKTSKLVLEATGDLKATVVPMIHSTRDLVQRITPEVITISSGLATLTETVKRETPAVKASAHEVMDRLGHQLQRLDSMLTASLNAVEKATNVVETTVSAPVRQVNGIIAALRAVVETYRSTESPRRPN